MKDNEHKSPTLDPAYDGESCQGKRVHVPPNNADLVELEELTKQNPPVLSAFSCQEIQRLIIEVRQQRQEMGALAIDNAKLRALFWPVLTLPSGAKIGPGDVVVAGDERVYVTIHVVSVGESTFIGDDGAGEKFWDASGVGEYEWRLWADVFPDQPVPEKEKE